MRKIIISIFRSILIIFVIVYHLSGCDEESTQLDEPKIRTTEYVNDPTNYPDPERGFFRQQLSDSNFPSALSTGYLDQLRDKNITN